SFFGPVSRTLILYLDQIQPVRWGGRPRGGAAARPQNSLNIIAAQRSLPNQDERAYQVSYHVMQEAIPSDRIYQLTVAGMPGGGKNCTHVVDFTADPATLRIHRRKRREIVCADHAVGCAEHLVLVQR